MSENLNMTELPAVARNIHLDCKKCGCERYHVVVAHTTPTSAKVKCEVCGAQKTFKLKKETAAKKTGAKSTKPRTRKSSGPDSATVWADLKNQIGVDRIQPYNMKTKYQLANAIEHPKFGLGFVTAAAVDKIDVCFQEAARSLVHNRP